MNEKMARLRCLLVEGYQIVEVASDDDAVNATLRRGADVTRSRFSRREAVDLLFVPRAA